ncbi:MAG TPA: GDP-mannose 4,6-dehydratase [Gaiellaceae bacterium]
MILVTGAAGFVGAHLLARLGDEAVAAQADVRDAAAVAAEVHEVAPTAIVHLAALSSVADSWSDPSETWRVNVLGTLNVVEAAAAGTRVVLASTGEVYGRARELPATEETPLDPISPYAASKAAAELVCAPARARGELELVVTRSFNTEGPGRDDRFAVGSWARQIAELELAGGGTLLVGDLTAVRDLVDVRDAVEAYAKLLGHDAEPGVYNVASGRPTAMEEVLDVLLGLARCRISVERDPARMRPADLPELWGDAAKLRAATGWEPAIPIEQTLAETLDYARATVAGARRR